MNGAPLDGNIAAGDLADFFAFEATAAITTCSACRRTQPVASLHAYRQAPGMVLRCADCGAVQMRLVRAPDRAWLDLAGIHMLELALLSDV